MYTRSSKFLALLITILLLFGTAVFAAEPEAAPQESINPFDRYDFSEADFTGTYGPDYLDMQQTSETPMPASAVSFTNIKNIVIFINFPGLPEFTTPTRMQSAQQVYSTRTDSLKNYISAHSYGDITVDTSFYPKNSDGTAYISYIAPESIDYYKPITDDNPIGYSDSQRFPREHALVAGAFNAVKAQMEADFTGAQLDNDNDGYIDSVAFIVNAFSGSGGGVGWNDLLWPHKTSTSGLYANGKQIRNYNILNSDIPPAGSSQPDNGIMSETPTNAPSNVIIHEFLHTLGFPDLYRYVNPGEPVAGWDILGSNYAPPPNMLQYMLREYMGWGKPIHELNNSGTYTLKAAQYINADTDGGYNGSSESAYIIRSPYRDDEFFVIEYRQKAGFDSGIYGSGLIVYRVRPSRNGNSDGPPDQVYIFRPNETAPTAGQGTLSNANLSSQSGRTTLGKPFGQETAGFDNGTIFFSDGTNSGIVISSVGWADYSISFTVTVPQVILGSGTESDPYQIYTLNQLQLMNTYPDKHFELKRDIQLNSSQLFTPIDNFTGTLNGNGYAIWDMSISGTGNQDAGMFRRLGVGSRVSNLHFYRPYVTGTQNVGVLAGTVAGTVDEIYLENGSVTNTGTGFTGALFGVAESTAEITNCIGKSGVSVTGNVAGGLAGKSESAVWNNCSYVGSVTSSGDNAVSGAIFAKQVVTSGYTPASGIYWSILGSQQTSAVGSIEKPVGSTVTGMEGLIGVQITPNDVTMTQGSTLQLTVETIPADTAVSGTWSFGNPNLVSINADGLATASTDRRGGANGFFSIPFYNNETIDFSFYITVLPAEG